MAKPHRLPVLLLLALAAACHRDGIEPGLRPAFRADPAGLSFQACPNPRTDGEDPFAPGPNADYLPDQQSLALFNDSRVPGSVRATLKGEGAELFQVMSHPDTLEVASQGSVVVRFSPKARGSVSATLELDDEYDDTDPLTVNLAGTGADLPDRPVLQLAVEDVPGTGHFTDCDGFACPVAFPDTQRGQASTLRISVRNEGCKPLRVVGAQVRPPADGSPSPFFLDVPAVAPTASSPLLVATGGSNAVQLSVRFAPPRTVEGNGSALGELVLQTNVPDAEELTLDLFGQWLSPTFSITPDTCDLSATGNACGATLAGGTSTGTFQVTNDGSAPLTFTGASFREGGAGGRFQLASTVVGQSLAPGASLPLQVRYQDAPLYVLDTLVLEAQSGGQPAGQVELPVAGGPPPDLATEPADKLVFTGATAVTTKQVTLRNEAGGGPLVLRRVSLEATASGVFELLGADALAGVTLQPGEARTVDVRYTPPAGGGGVSAVLRIEANIPNGVRTLPIDG